MALDEATRLDQAVEKLHGEGKFRDAVPLAERSLTLREKARGRMHPVVATSLNNLAELYTAQGAYGKAEPLFVRALDIREKSLGPMHQDVATSLNNLGVLYKHQGAYGKAESLLVRALDIREKSLGSMHPDVATGLDNLGELYRVQGTYEKARSLLIRALDIREKALGPMHLDVATSLNDLATLYWAQGNYDKAEPLLVRALDIREKALGPMHPDVATSLNDLGLLYKYQGAYDKAESLYVRALDIREKTLGPMHLDVAVSLNNLAMLYYVQGAYGKAEPLCIRALDIREKALGPMHPDVAQSLSNLALLYQKQGVYSKAEPLYVRALDIREKTQGPMHPDVAANLNNLASLYHAEGAYKKAEPLYVRALDISEKAQGPMHPDVAGSLTNLAALYRDQGTYKKAEPLYVRALNILEKTLGPTHPNVAVTLNNLALLYNDQGAHEKAVATLTRTIEVLEKALRPTHTELATGLNNLASLYWAQGAYAKAEPLFVRALDIDEKTLGRTHPTVAITLNNLALLYGDQGEYGKTEPLLVRALEINEKTLRPTHPAVAKTLNNLAVLYRRQGAYEKADPLYLRALDIREKALGPMHPDVAQSLNNLAELRWMQKAYGKAELLLSRAADIREEQLRVELARLPESRKRSLMKTLQGETDRMVSLQADVMPSSRHALELALTTILRRKGRILDSIAENETTLRAHLTPPLREQLDQLNRARAELVARLYAPTAPRSAMDRAAIAAVRARIDELESALSAASDEFRTQSEPVTIMKIQMSLPQDSALVEFVRYRRFDARQASQPWQEERYVAYLLRRSGPPQWVTLGAAAPIDAGIDAVLAAMDSKVDGETTKATLERLDALVLGPIRARLAGVSHVILAPDGKLNLVPFDALVDSRGHYALEQYLMSYMTTCRDLLRFAVRRPPRSAATIMAAPEYGPPRSKTCEGLGSLCPLNGAVAEATDLERYFPAQPLTGEKATKFALAALTGPAMLHIATHGFYVRDAGTRPTQAAGGSSRGMFMDGGSLSPRSEDLADALDRAGLALAGANQSADGIVTAREIAGFDWWGTQLVVLSACETGVGAVPSGDGVYGLRRALVLAGAASQVVSLWSVSDTSTSELMRDYYGELARGTDRAEALRQAKLRLLRQPRYAHPYYWAAFIPAGDWKPLDRHTMHRP